MPGAHGHTEINAKPGIMTSKQKKQKNSPNTFPNVSCGPLSQREEVSKEE